VELGNLVEAPVGVYVTAAGDNDDQRDHGSQRNVHTTANATATSSNWTMAVTLDARLAVHGVAEGHQPMFIGQRLF
jgi:hypothetical protein